METYWSEDGSGPFCVICNAEAFGAYCAGWDCPNGEPPREKDDQTGETALMPRSDDLAERIAQKVE